MRNKKFQVWLPLLFSLIMISGMFFGFKLNQQTGSAQGFFKLDKKSSLQEAMDLIKNKYVDSIGMDSLQNDALEDMVGHLDPHSAYIPASKVSDANEDIVGNFEGIGVEFNIFKDTVHIVYVIPNGPSDKAGLLIGDRIIKVDDSLIVSKTLASEKIRKMIRGEGGTKVKLTIVRNGNTQEVKVTRGIIPLPSVDASYILDTSIGYLRINKFSETTFKEFMQAMEGLKAKGMQSLVLDLRGNGGGLVSQAVFIADEFLSEDKLVVYTEGVNTPKREYRAGKDGVFETGKLMVLVDELSASASEILAGALQDWDRATIIGRRTFGKGLVQEQYQLQDGSALRLTVARYYTPIGRNIQRPYDQGKKVYMDEVYHRYQSGEMLTADSIHFDKKKAFKTKGGRTVYGGGGIMPDIFVPVDSGMYTQSVTRLYLDGRFNNFVYQYYINHLPIFNSYKSPALFATDYKNTDQAWMELVAYAAKDSINLQKVPAKERASIENWIKAYLARFKWRTEGFYEVLNRKDDVVAKAVQTLKK